MTSDLTSPQCKRALVSARDGGTVLFAKPTQCPHETGVGPTVRPVRQERGATGGAIRADRSSCLDGHPSLAGPPNQRLSVVQWSAR